MKKTEFTMPDIQEKDNNNSAKIVLALIVLVMLLLIVAVVFVAVKSNNTSEVKLDTELNSVEAESKNIDESLDNIKNDKIKVLEYPKSHAGNDLDDIKFPENCKDGYYVCMDTLYYNCQGRWFMVRDGEWEYEYITVAILGNNTEKCFVSEEYQKWFTEHFKATDIRENLIIE